jgi:hypothetical protein
VCLSLDLHVGVPGFEMIGGHEFLCRLDFGEQLALLGLSKDLLYVRELSDE